MPDDIYIILKDIQASQHKTEITLESIKGENKLQSQALAYHIDNLKDYKIANDKEMQDLDSRVKKLETWQTRMAGIVAVVTAIAVLLFDQIKNVVFGR